MFHLEQYSSASMALASVVARPKGKSQTTQRPVWVPSTSGATMGRLAGLMQMVAQP